MGTSDLFVGCWIFCSNDADAFVSRRSFDVDDGWPCAIECTRASRRWHEPRKWRKRRNQKRHSLVTLVPFNWNQRHELPRANLFRLHEFVSWRPLDLHNHRQFKLAHRKRTKTKISFPFAQTKLKFSFCSQRWSMRFECNFSRSSKWMHSSTNDIHFSSSWRLRYHFAVTMICNQGTPESHSQSVSRTNRSQFAQNAICLMRSPGKIPPIGSMIHCTLNEHHLPSIMTFCNPIRLQRLRVQPHQIQSSL